MSEVNNGIIVCRNMMMRNYSGQSQKTRLYALFRDHLELYHHMMVPKLPQSEIGKVEEKCFFEVVLGHRAQKPHFDIDVDLKKHPDADGEALLRNVVQCLIESLSSIGVKLDLSRDILLYTSCNPSKISYHIIVNNWFHTNNEQSKYLSIDVRSRMDPSLQKYLDNAVYGSKQQFRILWSSKLGSSRRKEPILSFPLSDTEVVTYPSSSFEYPTDELMASLIGCIDGCNPIPKMVNIKGTLEVDERGQLIEVGDNSRKKGNYEERKITRSDANQMLEYLLNAMGVNGPSTRRCLFKVREINSGIVSLTKERPYHCLICNRTHHNENPYLTISGNGTIYYHCRRAEDSCPVGNLRDSQKSIMATLPSIETNINAPPSTQQTPTMKDVIEHALGEWQRNNDSDAKGYEKILPVIINPILNIDISGDEVMPVDSIIPANILNALLL